MHKLTTTFAITFAAGAASADVISGTNSAAIEWGVVGTFSVTTGGATLNPSRITIAGATGAILDVNVTLNDGSHASFGDLEIVLVGPDGTAVLLTDNSRQDDDLNGDLTFDDQAALSLDGAAYGSDVSGSWKPTDNNFGIIHGGITPNAQTLSAFNGGDANGTWYLYVWDQFVDNTGSINAGWTIDIVTVPAPASAALIALGGFAASNRRH